MNLLLIGSVAGSGQAFSSGSGGGAICIALLVSGFVMLSIGMSLTPARRTKAPLW